MVIVLNHTWRPCDVARMHRRENVAFLFFFELVRLGTPPTVVPYQCRFLFTPYQNSSLTDILANKLRCHMYNRLCNTPPPTHNSTPLAISGRRRIHGRKRPAEPRRVRSIVDTVPFPSLSQSRSHLDVGTLRRDRGQRSYSSPPTSPSTPSVQGVPLATWTALVKGVVKGENKE